MIFPVPFAFLAALLSLTLLMRQIWKNPYFEIKKLTFQTDVSFKSHAQIDTNLASLSFFFCVLDHVFSCSFSMKLINGSKSSLTSNASDDL